MTSPFTLIVFSCHRVDLIDSHFGDRPTPLAKLLESIQAHRAEVYQGAYVFDTQKGWQDMYRLCEFLRTQGRSFLRLPFEGELAVYEPSKDGEELRSLGVTLLQYPRDER